jgi:hypothetical protein
MISKSIIHLIQTEFTHIDWKCPKKLLPPRRAVESANFVDTKPNSSVIVHLIQKEFSHIDWSHPERVLPPRRVLDWTHVEEEETKMIHWSGRCRDVNLTILPQSRYVHSETNESRMRGFARSQQTDYNKCMEKHGTASYCDLGASLASEPKLTRNAVKKETKVLDPIDIEIQMLEKEIQMLEVDVAKQQAISNSLIHLVQQEFSHIDWNCPLPVMPPRRVMDWSPEFQWTPGIDRKNLVQVKKDPIIVGRLNAGIKAAKTPEEKCLAHLKYCQDVMQCYEAN